MDNSLNKCFSDYAIFSVWKEKLDLAAWRYVSTMQLTMSENRFLWLELSLSHRGNLTVHVGDLQTEKCGPDSSIAVPL